MAQDMAPLSAAWSVIWARGDQELIRRANALLSACGDLIEVSTTRMPARTIPARLRRHVAGDRWTEEMLDSLTASQKAMAQACEQLAQYARRILDLRPAALFGHEPGDRDQVTADASSKPDTDASPDAAQQA